MTQWKLIVTLEKFTYLQFSISHVFKNIIILFFKLIIFICTSFYSKSHKSWTFINVILPTLSNAFTESDATCLSAVGH